MKKTIAIMTVVVLAGSLSASAALITGWETFGPDVLVGQAKDVAATQSATGAIGSMYIPGAASGTENNAANNTGGANTSGTFGASLAGASTDVASFNSGLQAGTTTAQYFEFTVTADAGYDLTLDTFYFDGAMGGGQSTRTYTLSVNSGSSITTGAVAGGTGGMANFNGLTEKDIDLTGLADNVLAAGESAVFRLDFVGNGNGGNGLKFDNAAIGGTVTAIPEPATLGLVVSFSGGLLFIRRRFMM